MIDKTLNPGEETQDAIAASDPGPTPVTADEGLSVSQRARKVVSRLAARLSHKHYPNGQLAELRRLDATHGTSSLPPVFWRFVVEDLEPNGLVGLGPDTDDLRPWLAICQGLATLADQQLHNPTISLGNAISDAGISELRMTRLLAAQGEALYQHMRSLAHQLRSKAQPVNWREAADLILSAGRDHADAVRQRVASDFYRREYRKGKSDT